MSFTRTVKSCRPRPVCAFLMTGGFFLRQPVRKFCRSRYLAFSGVRCFSAQEVAEPGGKYNLASEMEQARREARPYNIDKSKLSPLEREQLRLRSRAIPLVADKEPLDVIFEDDRFLVANKPSFLKMHPSHRFQGGSLLNRAIGHCGYAPRILHRLDMVWYCLEVVKLASMAMRLAG